MWIIYLMIVMGGGDLVKELIERQQYGSAVALAAVLSAAGLSLYWMESRYGECEYCDDPAYVQLKLRTVQRVLDSAGQESHQARLEELNEEVYEQQQVEDEDED